MDDGLPASAVTDVAQTPDGYLWVGTLLGGLARYDGVRFENYDILNTPGLKNASVRRLCLDNEGALWIAVYGSLVRWQGGVFHLEMEQDSRMDKFLFSDDRQVVFLTTDNHLLFEFKKDGGGYDWTRSRRPERRNLVSAPGRGSRPSAQRSSRTT